MRRTCAHLDKGCCSCRLTIDLKQPSIIRSHFVVSPATFVDHAEDVFLGANARSKQKLAVLFCTVVGKK